MVRSARVRTLLPLLRIGLHILLLVTATLIVLSRMGLDITPLLAGAGIVGLAIGFGATGVSRSLIVVGVPSASLPSGHICLTPYRVWMRRAGSG